MNRLLNSAVSRSILLVVVATVAAAILVPALGSSFAVAFAYQFMIWTALALSWNMFSGNSGYASFGHGVFFGVGTYIAAAVLRTADLPFGVAMLAAGAVAAALAMLVGLAVFSSPRFAGDLFGLITLVIAFIVMTIVSNVDVLDGGTGVFVREHVADLWVGSSMVNLFLVATLLAGIVAIFAVATSTTRWGAALRAIRDDEAVAESLGVPTYRYKVLTFGVSAGLAGLAGAPQAVFLGYVEVGAVFALSIPLFVIMMAILGGMSRWWGPLIGAAVIVILRESLLSLGAAEVAQIIVGLSLVVIIAVMPHGISGLVPRRRSSRVKGSAS